MWGFGGVSMSKLSLSKLSLLAVCFFILAPFACAYGVTFYNPSYKQQFGMVFEKIDAGTLYDFDVKNDALGITGISFRISRDVQGGGITIYKLLSSPEDLPEVFDVYEFDELKYTGFVPHDTESFDYQFRVSKSWLENSSVNRNAVALHGFDRVALTWVVFSSDVVREDDGFVYFTAKGQAVHYLFIGKSLQPIQTTPSTDSENATAEPVAESKKPEATVIVKAEPAKTESSETEQEPASDDAQTAEEQTTVVEQVVAPVVIDSSVKPVQPEPVRQMPVSEAVTGDARFFGVFILVAIAVVIVLVYLVFGRGIGRSSVDKELHNYIKESLKRGKSKDDVRKRLLEVGWHSERVEKALSKHKEKHVEHAQHKHADAKHPTHKK